MSGTLSPMNIFTEIIGVEEAETRSYSAIVRPENVRTLIDVSFTTRFQERSEKMFRRYGEHLSQMVDVIPNGVLIFFPQRNLMMNCLSLWKNIGILRQPGSQILLGGKLVFVEGEGASENRSIVEKYKSAARGKRGAVLCGVCRGRNAEGSNFPYEEARGVILIGVPYADFSDIVVGAQIRYFDQKRNGMGQRWYVMDGFKAANQALGRGIRHRDDWCNFILMDRRYHKHKNLISRWAVASGIKKIR